MFRSAKAHSLMKSLVKGFAVGLLLQFAVGPIFFFAVGTALTSGVRSGLAAVCAAALADYLFIALALVGVGALLERARVKRTAGIVAPVLLLGFGAWMVLTAARTAASSGVACAMSPWQSFAACFAMTVGSPLTIVFWMGVFSAKTRELGLGPRERVLFGVGAGLTTLVFLGACVLLAARVGQAAPRWLAASLNVGVGVILIGYGVRRLAKETRTIDHENSKTCDRLPR